MNNDGSQRISAADAMRARAAAVGLSLALDDGAAQALAERAAAASADVERMGELGLDGREPAVEFRPISARKERR